MFQPCRGLIILQASCHSLVHQTGEEISIMAGEELLELVTIVLSAVSCTTQRRGGGANHKEISDKRKSSSGYVGFSKKNLHELIFVNKYCYTKCVGSIIALCENYFIYNVKNLNELECTKTVKSQ